MELKEKKCKPCEGGVEPFNDKEINEVIDRIESCWKVIGLTTHAIGGLSENDFIMAAKIDNI
jgi:hypothetical protein